MAVLKVEAFENKTESSEEIKLKAVLYSPWKILETTHFR